MGNLSLAAGFRDFGVFGEEQNSIHALIPKRVHANFQQIYEEIFQKQ